MPQHYIDAVLKTFPKTVFVLFINDLRFLASRDLVKELATSLENQEKQYLNGDYLMLLYVILPKLRLYYFLKLVIKKLRKRL